MRYKRDMYPSRQLKLIFSLLLLLLLTGCGRSGPDRPFELYLDRLASTLDTTPSSPMLPGAVARMPRTGELRLEVAADSLEALDFLDLRGCSLQVTIGKRNSSLGRLARDSQKLLLELEYLRLAPECIAYLRQRGDVHLAHELQQTWEHKRQQLPARIFNATLANEEFQQLWRPVPLGSDYPGNTNSGVTSALEAVNALTTRWLSGDYQADNEAFELLLYDISLGDAGTLWRALAHQDSWLDEADRLLQQRLARGPLCPPGLRPDAAEILPAVVRKFFVEGIQPRAADLGRRYHQLLPPVRSLEQQLASVLPTDYGQWQSQRDSTLDALAQRPRGHVTRLQATLSSCQQQ